MFPAVIQFDFDATIQVFGLVVRWQTLGIAAAILIATSLAAILAGQTSVITVSRSLEGRTTSGPRRMSRESLVYIVCGAVPGALVGGRIGYVITHLDYYGANPGDAVNFAHGSFELTLAVLGGTVTAVWVARLFRESVGQWLHVAAVPLLVAIAGGKLAMALGASGQGLFSDQPWATAYLGAGPWGSLGPEVPSQPSQLYEALAAFLAAGVLALILKTQLFHALDGRVYYVGIALWCVGRLAVGFTWRDPAVLGSLGAEQILTLAVGLAAIATALAGDPGVDRLDAVAGETRAAGAEAPMETIAGDGVSSGTRADGPAT